MIDDLDRYQEGFEAGLVEAKRLTEENRSARNRERAAFRRMKAKASGERQTWGKGKMATPEDLEKVKNMRQQGLTLRQIRDQTGLGLGTVHRILKGGSP